ncbi:hypothetical protein V5N11_011149 [Cardamine amara subsp. amara]|uniref:Retrotransposon gag domain-containing protein n=1 Tax=Cardamine amara subsp. amara TaxID=228776 RepID=A0ABD0ZTZ7_CARAN
MGCCSTLGTRSTTNHDPVHDDYSDKGVEPRPRRAFGQRRGVGHDRGYEDQGPRPQVPSLKLMALTFASKVDPKAYLDWERRLDNICSLYAYDQPRKVAYAAAQLTDNALTWWDRDVTERRRNGERPMATWEVMKDYMRKQYVPPTYHCELQKKFRRFNQGIKSIEEYYEEFDHLKNHFELDESEKTLIAQFLDGMQDRIMRKVEIQSYHGFEELLHLVIQIEQQVKRKSASVSRSHNQSTPSWSPSPPSSNDSPRNQERSKPAIVESRFKPRQQEIPKDTRHETKRDPAPARSSDIVCFKCQGH